MRSKHKTDEHSDVVLPLATGRRADSSPSILLTAEELAVRLAVHASWIREKTRKRARQRDKDPLPVVRLGKYVRFDWELVAAWLARQAA